MADVKCVAYGCGKSKKNHPNILFFRVTPGCEKHEKWLDAVGRDDLIRIKHTYYEICSDHFEPNMMKTITLLKSNAEPTMNWTKPDNQEPSKIKTPLVNSQKPSSFDFVDSAPQSNATASVYPQQSTSSKCKIKYEPADEVDVNIETQSVLADTSTQTEVSMCLRDKLSSITQENIVQGYKIKIKFLNKELQKMNSKYKSIQNSVICDELTKNMCDLLNWKERMKAKYKNKHNSTEFHLFALNLYVLNRNIYKKLKDGLNLPSVNFLRQLNLRASSKLNVQTFNCLTNKIRSLPDKAKYCTIVIDTIDLKRHLYYNITRDEIIALHNFHGHETNMVASAVFFVMLRGIAFDWNQPIAYIFLANKTCFSELDNWLNKIIEELSNIGVKIMAFTSNQQQHFVSYAASKSVTVEKPFFISNGQKVFYIFDAPHLLTCLRNDLIENEFYYKKQKISWSYIEALIEYREKNKLNYLPKITDAHVTPSSLDKRNVKFAAQIFSHSVFTMFELLMDIQKIPTDAKATAQFIKTINNLFDILNSNKLKCDNECQSAFTLSNNQMESLMGAQKMFKALHVVDKASNTKKKVMHTFTNIQITIHALVLLSSCLKEHGIKQILTRRLNKEPLDSFKKIIKAENCKVTPKKFTREFDKQLLLQMLSNTKAKEGDCFELFKSGSNNLISATTLVTDIQDDPSERTSPVSLHEDFDYRFQLPKTQAFTYVAGYLLFKCSKKHKCPDFDEMQNRCPLLELQENINEDKDFSGRLKIPPVEFCKNVRKLDDIFVKKFAEAVISKPATTMLILLQKVIQPPCTCFPTQYFLTLFIRFKIYSILIYNKTISPCSSQQEVQVNALLD